MKRKNIKLDYNIIGNDGSYVLQIIYEGDVYNNFKEFNKKLNEDFNSQLLIRDLAIKQLEKEKSYINLCMEKFKCLDCEKKGDANIDFSDICECYVLVCKYCNSTNIKEIKNKNQLKTLVEGMTSNTGKLIQFTSNLARISLKPFKKEINQLMKQEK